MSIINKLNSLVSIRWTPVHDRALPFDGEQGIPVDAILADKGSPMVHLFEIFLDFNERSTPGVGIHVTSGFVAPFNRTKSDDFFRTVFREKFYKLMDLLQGDVDSWPHHYDYERPPYRARQHGTPFIETVERG